MREFDLNYKDKFNMRVKPTPLNIFRIGQFKASGVDYKTGSYEEKACIFNGFPALNLVRVQNFSRIENGSIL